MRIRKSTKSNPLFQASIAMKWPKQHLESIWVKKIRGVRFEVRSIPYFAYNLSLGDIVECHPDEDGIGLFVDRIVKKSGNRTVRVGFKSLKGTRHPEARKLIRYLKEHSMASDDASPLASLIAINVSMKKYDNLILRIKQIPKSAKVIWEDGDPQPGIDMDGSSLRKRKI